MLTQDLLLPFLFAIAIGGVALIFRMRFRTIINPPTLHALAFLSQFIMYVFMQAYAAGEGLHFDVVASTTNITGAYLLASVSFALPWLALRKVDGYLQIDSLTPSVRDLRSFKFVVFCEIMVLMVVLVLAIGWIGFPLGAMLAGNLDVQQMQENARALPAGLLAMNLWIGILLSLQLAAAITFRAHYKLSGRQLAVVVLMIIFSAIWQAKRQVLLIMLVFIVFFLVADRARRDKLWRTTLALCGAFIVFLVIYMAVQFVRVGDIGEGVAYAELALSAIWPLLNLDRIMAFTEGIGQLYGLVSQLIPNRLSDYVTDGFVDVLFEPTSSASYVLFAYYDFGYIGIAGAAFLFGVITRWFSYLFRSSVTGVQIKVLVLWVCISSPVYSHAFSLNFFLFPVLLLYLLRTFIGSKMYVKSAIHST